MKRKCIYLLMSAFMLSFTMNLSAQERMKREALTPEQRVEVRAQRLSNKLMLDEATTAKFIPLYKAYMAELQGVCKECNKKGDVNYNDAQIVENLENCFSNQAKVAEIKRSYVGKFSKILTARQLQKLFASKDDKMKPGDRKMKDEKGPKGKKGNKRDSAPRVKGGNNVNGANIGNK